MAIYRSMSKSCERNSSHSRRTSSAQPAVRERLVEKGDRPLFTSVEQAARLFAERAPFYKMAPVRVALTGRESIEESTDKVLSAVYDRRELGVIFLEAEISLPRSQLRYLFWPHPYWIAGLALLAAIAAWGLRAGLSFV